MKILVAADSYKGCMTSEEANARIKAGLIKADPSYEVETFPVSDGGEGFIEAYLRVHGGQMCTIRTYDLYRNPIIAPYGYDPKTRTAVVEAASTLGLTLYPRDKRRPMATSSYGFGYQLRKIMERDVRTVIIGLGGTGCADGGMGFLEAFGCVFYNESRRIIPAKAMNLSRVAFIDKSRFSYRQSVELRAACDVTSSMLGEEGMTWMYGKQKGLSRSEQYYIENGMEHFIAKLDQTFHRDLRDIQGGGSAGGLGGVLIGIFRARRTHGIDLLCEEGALNQKIKNCDLLITGEGQTDYQTLHGKAVYSLAQLARNWDIPVICISGALGIGYEGLYDCGVSAMFSTADRAMPFSQAIRQGPQKLEQTAYNIAMFMKSMEHLKGKKKE